MSPIPAPSPTVVIIAAGRGSRYGGARPMDEVGAGGESLLDYAVFDARRAGFTRIVLVTREELARGLIARANRFPVDLEVRHAVQPLTAGAIAATLVRWTRPWGTVHAVLSATAQADADAPVVALHADDFHGQTAYQLAMAACDHAIGSGDATVIAMPLDVALSDRGPVVRAVCETAGGWLTRIEELHGIVRTADGIIGQTSIGESRRLSGGELVSMNLWVLPPAMLTQLAGVFERFVESHAGDRDAELLLPDAIGALVARGSARVRVTPSPGPWFVLTQPQDRTDVVAALERLADEGAYPRPLWRSRRA